MGLGSAGPTASFAIGSMSIVSGLDADGCTTDTDLPALRNDGNSYPVAFYRNIVPRFIGKETDAGIEARGRQVVSSAEIVLKAFM